MPMRMKWHSTDDGKRTVVGGGYLPSTPTVDGFKFTKCRSDAARCETDDSDWFANHYASGGAARVQKELGGPPPAGSSMGEAAPAPTPVFLSLTLSETSPHVQRLAEPEDWFVRQYMSTQWQHAAATSVHAPGQPRPSRKISAGRSQLHVQRRAGIPREYELLPPAPVIHHPPSKVLGIEGWWASAAEVERWVQAIARLTDSRKFSWKRPGRVGDMMDACPKPAMLCDHQLRIMFCNPQAVDLLGLSLDRLIREQRRLGEVVTTVAGGAPKVSLSLRDEAARLAALFGGAAGTEVTVRHHSGAQERAVMSMSRVRDMNGELLFLAVFHQRPNALALTEEVKKHLEAMGDEQRSFPPAVLPEPQSFSHAPWSPMRGLA